MSRAHAVRLIVTRPAAQAGPWVEALRQAGVDAVALPLIGIAPPHDSAVVHAAWATLPDLSWVMFVSANAVEQFFAGRPPGATWPAGLSAGATGPGTSAALRAAGVSLVDEPDVHSTRFDSETLWARVAARPWAGNRVLIVRGEDGREWLAEALQGAGARVDFVAAYRRVAPVADAAGTALLAAAQQDPAGHAWHFGSSEAVARLVTWAPGDWPAASPAIASHPRIAQAAREAGFLQVHLVPPAGDALRGAEAVAACLRSLGPRHGKARPENPRT